MIVGILFLIILVFLLWHTLGAVSCIIEILELAVKKILGKNFKLVKKVFCAVFSLVPITVYIAIVVNAIVTTKFNFNNIVFASVFIFLCFLFGVDRYLMRKTPSK